MQTNDKTMLKSETAPLTFKVIIYFTIVITIINLLKRVNI